MSNIGLIANLSNVFSQNGATGHISLPVSPSDMIYTQLSHVKGIATTSGNTVPISRIQIIDHMISRLYKLEDQAKLKAQISSEKLKSQQLDKMVEKLNRRMKNKIKSPFTIAEMQTANGNLLSILA